MIIKTKRSLLTIITLLSVLCISCAALVFFGASKADGDTRHIEQSYYVIGGTEPKVTYGAAEGYGVRGVKATLDYGASLVMKRVISLDSLGKNGEIIRLMATPERKGACDYTVIKVEIVDAYDENNFVTLQMKPYVNNHNTCDACFALACASNGQQLTGKERGYGGIRVNEWGAWINLTFSGLTYSAYDDISKNTFAVCFDSEEKIISFSDYCGTIVPVADLDNPDYFGSNLWNGFTSDLVYCRVKIEEYIAGTGSLVVTKYGKYDLTQDTFEDKEGPEIKIDTLGYDAENLPHAVIGKKYRVFDALAYDLYSGEVSAETEVYLNYYSNNSVKIPVHDGFFKTSYNSEYYIVYKATDYSGNVSERVLTVRTDADYVAAEISFDGYPETAKVGEKISLPEYDVSGGAGEKEVKISATLNGKEEKITDGAIRCAESGTLVVNYEITDFIAETVIVKKEIKIEKADKPAFIEIPYIPDNLVAGNRYYLPVINGYDYITAAGTPVKTEISVTENGNTRKLESNEYIPSVRTSGETSEIIYTAKVGAAENVYKKTVTVYKAENEQGRLDMSKLFLSDGGSAVAEVKGILLKNEKSTACYSFLNYVGASTFGIAFNGTEKTSGVNEINVYLRDLADSKKSLKFTYEHNNGSSYFYLNNDSAKKVALSGSFRENEKIELNLDLFDKKVNFDVNTAGKLDITTYVDGQEFKGFTYNKVLVDIEIISAESGAEISLNSINANMFSNGVMDRISPVLDILGEYGGTFRVGEKVSAPETLAIDVISGDCPMKLSVSAPDGSVVVDNIDYDGKGFEFDLKQFGEYYVAISAEDLSGNAEIFQYSVTAKDDEKPVLSKNGSAPEKAKVGETFEIPVYSASVGSGKTVDITVYVCAPDGKTAVIGSNCNGYTAASAGTYKFLIRAEDNLGNIAFDFFTVIVEEK